MAEITHDLRSLPRNEAYGILHAQLDSVLDGVDDRIAAMATVAALVHHGFGHLWTGFYQVVEPGIRGRSAASRSGSDRVCAERPPPRIEP